MTKKHFFDRRHFKVVDTPEKAYWLGFITADGSIGREGVEVGWRSETSNISRC